MRFSGHPSLRAVGCPSQRPGETNGPPQWENRKLFEAVRPSFCDLVSAHGDGSKTSYQRARRGYARSQTFEHSSAWSMTKAIIGQPIEILKSYLETPTRPGIWLCGSLLSEKGRLEKRLFNGNSILILLPGLGTDTWDIHDILCFRKGAMGLPILDNVFSIR